MRIKNIMRGSSGWSGGSSSSTSVGVSSFWVVVGASEVVDCVFVPVVDKALLVLPEEGVFWVVLAIKVAAKAAVVVVELN